MNNQTVHELRNVAKNRDLCGYYRIRKADLTALISEKSTQEMSSEQSTQKKG